MGLTLWRRHYGLPNLRRRDIPDVRDIIKLRNDVVPVIWSSKAVHIMDLRAKVTKDDDSRLVRPVEQRANQKFKVFHTFLVTDEETNE